MGIVVSFQLIVVSETGLGAPQNNLDTPKSPASNKEVLCYDHDHAYVSCALVADYRWR